MRDFIDFCLLILQKIVGCWFGLDLGKYSFGDFLVGILVVSVFISCLVISFRRQDPSSVSRPPRPVAKRKKKPGSAPAPKHK